MGEDESKRVDPSPDEGDGRKPPVPSPQPPLSYGPPMREQGAQADDPHAPGSGALGQRLEAFVSGAAYGVLAVLGFVLGLIGSFLFSGTIGSVPVAAIVLVLLNFACFRLAAWAMCSPLGALAPAVPWLVVVVLMSARRPEGDLVITGTTPGYLFMVGGMIAGLVAVVAAFSRSAGSWLLRGVDVDSRAR